LRSTRAWSSSHVDFSSRLSNSVRFRSVVVSLALPRSSTMLCFLPHLGYPMCAWGHKWCVCNNMQCDGRFHRNRLGSARVAKRRSLRRAGARRPSKSQRSSVAGRDRPEFDGDLQLGQSDLTNRSPATAVNLMPVDFVIANKTKSDPVETLRLWESDHEKMPPLRLVEVRVGL
jgi:hypothetical protein